MKYLFSGTGMKVIESLAFTKTLYAFDFDGTLAPIVDDPGMARAAEGTLELLEELSRRVPVAVISGRSVSDLRRRVRIRGNLLIGNHGVEGLGAKKSSVEKARLTCRRWLSALRSDPDAITQDPGTVIEDKRFSLALHYRNSRNRRLARGRLFTMIEKLQPTPRVIPGKCVLNLLPAGGPHKGVALLEAMMKLDLRCALYIGDDDTDEDVFTLPDDRIVTVRVGMRRGSQAQFFVRRQAEVNRLLRALLRTGSA